MALRIARTIEPLVVPKSMCVVVLSEETVRQICAALLIVVAASGCAVRQYANDFSQEDVVAQTVNFNAALATTSNQMHLLNILRAAFQEPMYFAALSTQHGALTYSAETGGLVLPFGGDADSEFSITPKLSVSANPSFDIKPLNTRDFYRGILSPVPAQTIGYYVDQGWPQDLLLTLLVRRIEYEGTEYVGDPSARAEPGRRGFEDYRRLVSSMRIGMEPRTTCLSGVLDDGVLADTEELRAIREAGLRLVRARNDEARGAVVPDDDVATRTYCLAETVRTPRVVAPFTVELTGDGPFSGSGVTIYPRSPEGVLYFLGEVVRHQLANPGALIKRRVDDDPERADVCEENLFVLEKEREGVAYQLRVERADVVYGVPEDFNENPALCDSSILVSGGRTMHVLSFVTQLMGLFQSREDLPQTQTVRLVN